MSSPIYQNVIDLVVTLSIRRGPGIFMNAVMGKMVLMTTKFLDVAKFTTLTPLSLLILCELSFPIVGLTRNLDPFMLGSFIPHDGGSTHL
jgi:hypothetical protein